MDGKKMAGVALLLGAAAAGFYAYSKGWYSGATNGLGQLNDRQQALKWYGEQLQYRGRSVDVHDFVDGGTGLSTTMAQHLSSASGRKLGQNSYQRTNNAVGRPL